MNNSFNEQDNGYTGVRLDEKQGGAGKALLVLGVFIAAIIGVIVVSQTYPLLTVSVFGALFAVLSIIALTDKKNRYPDERLGAAAFLMGGVTMTVVPIIIKLLHSKGGHTPEKLRQIDLIIGAAVMIHIGLMVIIIPALCRRMKTARCTYPVTATCVELLRRRGKKHGRYLYAPVWQYAVGSGSYTNAETTYSNINVPNVGDTTELMVNPDDPNDIFRNNRGTAVFTAILGAAFCAFGVLLLVMAF